MSPRRFLGAVPLALLACADSSPSALLDPPRSPLSDIGTAPAEPGRSGVFRVEGRLAFFLLDESHGLLSFHGIDTPWADLCTGTPPAFDPVALQFIFTPAGAAEAVFQSRAHTVLLYPAADIGFTAGPEDCAVMASLPLLARGPASFLRTDNDFFGSGGPRVNAFGWQAHGVLENAATGGDVGYRETARFVIDQADPPAEITPQVSAIVARGL